MKDYSKPISLGVVQTCDQLSDGELAILCLVVTAGWDPHEYPWYEKAKSLFTEDGGTKVREETDLAIARILYERLQK